MPDSIHPAPIIPPPVSTPFPDDGAVYPGFNPLACLGGAQPTPGLPPPIVLTIWNGGHWVSVVYNADGSGGTVVAADGACVSPAVPVARYPWAGATAE